MKKFSGLFSRVCGALKSIGRLFHRRGAAEQKARSPIVRRLVPGTSRRIIPYVKNYCTQKNEMSDDIPPALNFNVATLTGL